LSTPPTATIICYYGTIDRPLAPLDGLSLLPVIEAPSSRRKKKRMGVCLWAANDREAGDREREASLSDSHGDDSAPNAPMFVSEKCRYEYYKMTRMKQNDHDEARETMNAISAIRCALHGETDLHAIDDALSDPMLAKVIALSSNVHPIVHLLAAFSAHFESLATDVDMHAPDVLAAVQSSIGTKAGRRILPVWAMRGASCRDTMAWDRISLIRASECNLCPTWVPAALVGPHPDCVARLHTAHDIARAIRVWGESDSDEPDWWAAHLSRAERTRLLTTLQTSPCAYGSCLPWLPKDDVNLQGIDQRGIPDALDAFIFASPSIRASSTAMLRALAARVGQFPLYGTTIFSLTRLCHVSSALNEGWDIIMHGLRHRASLAEQIVVAAPWNDLPEAIRAAILSYADTDEVCAAIALARGQRGARNVSHRRVALSFFASVTPDVWNALPTIKRQPWIHAMDWNAAPLAIRNLGVDDRFLMRVQSVTDTCIEAVRLHIDNVATVRSTLLPLVLRDMSSRDVVDIIESFPTPPPRPVTFVRLASNVQTVLPPSVEDASVTPSLPDLCEGIKLLRSAMRESDARRQTHALRDALPPNPRPCDIMVLAAITPDLSTLAEQISAAAQRRDMMRVLMDICTLPPAIAAPTLHALSFLGSARSRDDSVLAMIALADALHTEGRRFTSLMALVKPTLRTTLLPLLEHPDVWNAFSAIAHINPPSALALVRTLNGKHPASFLVDVRTLPPTMVAPFWNALPHTTRSAVIGDIDELVQSLAVPEHANDLVNLIHTSDPLFALALRMLNAPNPDQWNWGVSALTLHPDLTVAVLPILRDNVRMMIESNPLVIFAIADLPSAPAPSPSPPVRRITRRTRG
jgi:hypothetical protein